MHEHKGKRAKDARKKRKPNGVAQSKQGKYINIAWSRERCVSSTPTPRRCISLVATPNQSLGGMDATAQASLYGTQSMAKTRSREASTVMKHRSKQAIIVMHKKMIQTL